MARATKAAAKVAGKTHGAIKALEGYGKIFHHLAAEHAELATLMKRIASSADDSDVRDELFPEVRTNLLAHAHAEESEFYPVLERYPELETLVSHCREDHEEIDARLDEVEAAGSTKSAAWLGRFKRLMEAVTHHVQREEQELFPAANRLLNSETSEAIFESYESFEQEEKSATA